MQDFFEELVFACAMAQACNSAADARVTDATGHFAERLEFEPAALAGQIQDQVSAPIPVPVPKLRPTFAFQPFDNAHRIFP